MDSAGFHPGVHQELVFQSGVVVSGIFDYVIQYNGRNILFSFTGCKVTYKGEILFRPEWGRYDMAIGESVVSAFQGPADPDKFEFSFEPPFERTHKIVYTESDLQKHALYQQLRDARVGKVKIADFNAFFHRLQNECPSEWLLMLEFYEFLKEGKDNEALQSSVRNLLEEMMVSNPQFEGLIGDGLRLC
ncbi:MAG: hypothetical protein HGA37_15465 [Lentimicrobium sp.]|nr:hypothetical protein [Lentimicrobium sp.]